MAFTERKVTDFEWNDDNKGIEVVGRLIAVEEVHYKDGPGHVYTLNSEKTRGEIIRFRGATRLNAKLHKTDEGKVVSVRYNGEDKSKRGEPWDELSQGFYCGGGRGRPKSETITDLDVPF